MLFVWIGAQVADDWAKATFGVNGVSHIDTEKNAIPEKDTKESRMLRKLIEYVHEDRPRRMKVVDRVATKYTTAFLLQTMLIRQGDKLEPWCRKYLVEDKSPVSANQSYVDYLCHIHREIRAILS